MVGSIDNRTRLKFLGFVLCRRHNWEMEDGACYHWQWVYFLCCFWSTTLPSLIRIIHLLIKIRDVPDICQFWFARYLAIFWYLAPVLAAGCRIMNWIFYLFISESPSWQIAVWRQTVIWVKKGWIKWKISSVFRHFFAVSLNDSNNMQVMCSQTFVCQ